LKSFNRQRTLAVELINLKEMYISELQELVSAQTQLAEPLARIAEVASHPALKEVLTQYSEATLVQQKRLQSILRQHDADGETHTDQAMQALVAEVKKMLLMLRGDELRDAGLTGSIQRLVHYEIAAYGTTATLAEQLGLSEEQRLLHRSLEEQKQFDETLTRFAKGTLNPHAVSA
jgi:ferritin-like metal-binding protein YciE